MIQKLNEKHRELLTYLATRESSRTTHREIVRHTALASIGSVAFALKTLIRHDFVQQVSKSTYKVLHIDRHVDGYVVRPDGDKWFAALSGFRNLQVSRVAFGDTPAIALGRLIAQEKS